MACPGSFLSEAPPGRAARSEQFCKPDAFGHHKKVSICGGLQRRVEKAGHETVVSDLTYDLRSGEPDVLDKIICPPPLSQTWPSS